ncbi:phage GP46 family protein [Pectobacterium cacticida]|uniref:phage GP46 family protein n=1 Tax=Pectobacterium cacticida TaxID=69221 RepID=UPI0035EEF85D
MDNLLNPTTGDYTGTTTTTLANAVYLRLTTPLGSWWADPLLGSRLHLLARKKRRSPRVQKLARQYAEEALQPLILMLAAPRRFPSLSLPESRLGHSADD